MLQKLTSLLYRVTENMENISGNEESVKFDSSFDILASGIETNVLKAWKVVTMSELYSRFHQLLREEGIEASNYKSLYLQNKIEKRFRNKLSFWRSNDNSSYMYIQM